MKQQCTSSIGNSGGFTRELQSCPMPHRPSPPMCRTFRARLAELHHLPRPHLRPVYVAKWLFEGDSQLAVSPPQD